MIMVFRVKSVPLERAKNTMTQKSEKKSRGILLFFKIWDDGL